ncbi:hypothetical protein RSOLAG1IB_11306 [Rhizoctonia solani AG-1 IB]|uniref:Uncharacterized protein n=1 Tax=Thanatephorus cucumeris (strain AG1-IB / isolate 7/3/14) TaxID=1108050 RepID=M5CEG6_THACB|nr:hypothetical protein BN14_08419 [Rhizoctonia solani AG-1 IB]CEL53174.1 hypothetical protein RSOLAG1IB_11306 [Rhizoctonia solani AG-1 IB]
MSIAQVPETSAAQFITSSTRHTSSVRILNPLKSPVRFADIVAGIARTKKILVMSGDGAHLLSGLLPLESPVLVQQGGDFRRKPLRTVIMEATRGKLDELSSNELCMYNRAMVERRVAARKATPGKMIDFLKRLCDDGRLSKCLTTSIDGFECQSSSAVADLVIPLYGDNRLLRCATPSCRVLSEEDSATCDEKMSGDEPASCRRCTLAYTKANKQRRKGTAASRWLRPAVQLYVGLSFVSFHVPNMDTELDESDDYDEGARQGLDVQNAVGRGQKKTPHPRRRPIPVELPQLDSALITQFHGGSKLLLIVGTQPKDPELLNLTRELAQSIHDADGAVIYIDPSPLHGTQHDHIDIQLQSDVDVVLGDVLSAMDREPIDQPGDLDESMSDNEIWYEIIQNDIPLRFTEKEAPYNGELCIHCGCNIPEYLARCMKCVHHYCYRRVQRRDINSSMFSIDASALELVDKQGMEGIETDDDHFAYHEACISFNQFTDDGTRPSIAGAAQTFICPDCWDHQQQGLYPHYVRPIARESVEVRTAQWPRMAMVIYYVEAYWPQTKNLMTLMAGRWRQLGWECILEPVKLQHLSEKSDVFSNFCWEPGTYQLVAVYITHGLIGEQGYQLNNSEALRPAEVGDN